MVPCSPWLRDYPKLQTAATILLNIQVVCGLIGSIGALYSGQLMVGTIVGLFALVAIESGSRSLISTYFVLLPCTLLLDVAWIIFYYWETRQYDPVNFGEQSSISVKVEFWMQISGFLVRCLSLLPWFHIYMLRESSQSIGIRSSRF
ncbi:hypothetical protein AMTRI_Chr02g262470 [Amborella trichopoda]